MSDDGFDFTRRKALAGLGAIGIASTGAGLGTTAYFSDTESLAGNTVQAGQLNLIVDYETGVVQGSAEPAGTVTPGGEADGDNSYEYTVADAKPGDEGSLRFCPKVVDNPGWVWVGSDSGLTSYENGQTEPEADADATGGGSLGDSTSGAGAGDLAQAIQVTVSYCDENGDNKRELNNPSYYTLADLLKDLESGFLLDGSGVDDGSTDAYPASQDGNDQQGPCLCIDWTLPTTVGNEIQSDAVSFDVEFYAVQERHNGSPANPFVDLTVGTGGSFDYDSIQAAVDAASAGDVVAVAAGTFEEVVTVGTADLTLVAARGATPTIDGSGASAALTVAGGIAGVTVDGFEITNPGGLLGIKLEPGVDDVTICDNRIFKIGPTGELGVSGINVGTGDHANIRIVRNVIEDLKQEINANSGYPTLNGILFDGKGDSLADATVAHNVIRGLESDVAPLGIVLQPDAANVSIRGNELSQFTAAHSVDSDDTDDGAGEYTTYAQGLSIDSSSTEHVDIVANVFAETITSDDGYWGESIKIEGNVDVSGITIAGNDLLSPFGLTNAASDSVDATENYWNSSGGPNTDQSQSDDSSQDNRPTTASVLLGPADYGPYLSASIQ
jgi:predicted ribosomally synthesized peptide with SipW-like signal peptide